MSVLARLLVTIVEIADILLLLYMIALFAVVIVSWFAPRSVHPAVMFLRAVTRPVLTWLKRKFPFLVQGGFDLSPMVAFFAIYFIQRFVLETLREAAARMG